MKTPKLPQAKLDELINYAETELRKGGTLTQTVNKIENIAYGNGYRVDRKEVKLLLVAKCAKEVLAEMLPSLPTPTMKLQ